MEMIKEKIDLPKEFVDRMGAQLKEQLCAFLDSYKKPCVKSLRVNTLKLSVQDYIKLSVQDYIRLSGQDDFASRCRVKWESAGLYYAEGGDAIGTAAEKEITEEKITEQKNAGGEDTEQKSTEQKYTEQKSAGDNVKGSEELVLTSPGKSPYHAAGLYYIQEASAMLPVTRLSVDSSGLKVLDLCAAPGGKSTQIASYMKGKGLLVSNEIVPQRARILSENIERMGVSNALVISEDPERLADKFVGFFDRILVDAPCSGEGMFRKHPEAIKEWSIENVKMCAKRQEMILDCAVRMLSANGRIVYSTCTFSPDEDEEICNVFLTKHKEFKLLEAPSRIFPHKERAEGHFAAVFTRGNVSEAAAGDLSVFFSASGAKAVRKRPKEILSKQERALVRDFLKDTIDEKSEIFDVILGLLDADAKGIDEFCDSRLLRFGDSIYIAPKMTPDLTGIKVLRAGLKIGEFKKNRFEPDHALAIAIKPMEALRRISFCVDSSEIKGYLSGNTIEPGKTSGILEVSSGGLNEISSGSLNEISNVGAASKGYCLVCVDNYPLGWGKCAGGIIKNHYPKGLRVV